MWYFKGKLGNEQRRAGSGPGVHGWRKIIPRNVAKFQEQIERFFIAGAARIDLIAKVIDLDNQIGGYNFDIPNLQETANELQSLENIGGKAHFLIK